MHQQRDACIEELARLLGDRFSLDEKVRSEHGGDESSHEPAAPDAVAFPESTQEVAQIVKVCSKHRMPIIPYGRGTAVEGGVVATSGGVCLDVARMNRILEINLDDLDATVQAGVTQFALNHRLADSAYFFSVDPGAEATLGGMAATRASGTNAVRYGTMRDNVLGLTVVLADGRIIHTSSRARKSAAGYDLTRLFVGSEGTLGVITELAVRLHCRPEALSAAVCAFSDIQSAVETAMATIQAGIPVARVELLDEVSMEAVCRYAKLDYPVAPTLFFEFQGTERGVVEQAQRVGMLAAQRGGSAFRWAADEAGREQLWQARHDAYYALVDLRPGARSLTTDVCVPISRLAECIRQTKHDLTACRMPAFLLGHVGDGNFHVLFLIDPHDQTELAEAQRLNHRIVERALEMQGTCTGEHGIGLGKIEFLESEFGEAMWAMRAIKRAMDPHNLMNPGKVLRS